MCVSLWARPIINLRIAHEIKQCSYKGKCCCGLVALSLKVLGRLWDFFLGFPFGRELFDNMTTMGFSYSQGFLTIEIKVS